MDDLPDQRPPVSADILLLAFGSTAASAARHEIRALLHSADPDGVHRVRAALRRLRTVLRLLPPEYRKELGDFRRQLKRLSRALGEVRDLDVFVATLLVVEAKGAVDASAIAAWAEMRRAHARERLLAALPADETSDPLVRLQAWFKNAGASSHRTRRADRLLDRAWRKLRRRATNIERLGPHARHKVRIRARRLQVALDILAPPLFPAPEDGPGARFVERLACLQGRLGDLNDIATARRLLGEVLRSGDGPPRATIRAVEKALRARGRRLKRRSEADFEALVESKKAAPWPPIAAGVLPPGAAPP